MVVAKRAFRSIASLRAADDKNTLAVAPIYNDDGKGIIILSKYCPFMPNILM